MEKCWAHLSGNCSEKISGEHLVSKGILEEMGGVIRVQGFNWCKDEPKEIGMNALQSNFLCVRHNNLLSNYDKEAINFFRIPEAWQKKSEFFKEKGFHIRKIPIKYSFNGFLLERWFLKTMVNLVLVNIDDKTVPFDKILPYLYEGKKFETPYGFGFIVKSGDNISFNGNVDFRPFFNQEGVLCCGTFDFRGFTTVIILPVEGTIVNNQLAIDIDGSIKGSQINWHNEEISETMKRFRKTYTVQKILIDWTD